MNRQYSRNYQRNCNGKISRLFCWIF